MRSLLAQICLVLLLTPILYSQTNATDGAIDGFVQDETNAFIPGAAVTVKNLLTGVETTTQTDSAGYYRLPLLKIGEYEVHIEVAGFGDFRQSGIQLSVGKQARVSAVLKVGAAAESVSVTADAAIVETSGHPSIDEVLDEKAIRSLPMTSRNVYNLHLLGPGVKGIPSTGFGTTQFTFGGLSRSTWTVDGLDNTQRQSNRQIRLVITTPESVQEMQVVSGSYSAEFGRAAGGVINVISRSGTNEFHGSGMGMFRPNELAARSPLAATKGDQSWWMMAGNVGGPLKKDGAWFFVNDEYNPLKGPQPVTINAAVAATLKIAASDLGNSPLGETFHTPSAKVNYRLSDKNSGFIRYSRFTNTQPGGGGGLTTIGRSTDFKDRMNGVSAQLATVVTPSVLNETRFGFNRRSQARRPVGKASGPDDAAINISGVANFGVNAQAGSDAVEASAQIIDNITWTSGRQTFKAGVDYQHTAYTVINSKNRTFSFNGLTASGSRPTVSPLDQYLRTLAGEIDPATNRPYTYTQLQQDIGNSSGELSFNFLNLFFQDEIRVSPTLTLSAGIRYETLFYPGLDPEAPHALSRKINNDLNNFAPRLGFSWSPTSSGRTALRGGYGIYYDSPSLAGAQSAYLVNGRRLLSYVVPGTDARSPRFPDLLQTADPTFATPPSITVFAPDFETMYGHNATLQLEHALTKDMSANVQYSFWGHRFAPFSRDINLSAPVRILEDGRPVFQGSAGRPDAAFRAINMISSGSNSNYNGLDLTLRKRFGAGFQLSTTYSWSHALSDSDTEGGALTDPTNRRREYGNSNADVRSNWVFQGLFAPRSARKWADGFEFSTTTFFNSGYPVNSTAGVDLNQDLVLNDRPLFRSRNAFDGPNYLQMDVRVLRRIRFQEHQSVEIIAESENVMNRLNANCSIAGCTGAVQSREGLPDFLRITASRPGRQLQFGMRYTF